MLKSKETVNKGSENNEENPTRYEWFLTRLKLPIHLPLVGIDIFKLSAFGIDSNSCGKSEIEQFSYI